MSKWDPPFGVSSQTGTVLDILARLREIRPSPTTRAELKEARLNATKAIAQERKLVLGSVANPYLRLVFDSTDEFDDAVYRWLIESDSHLQRRLEERAVRRTRATDIDAIRSFFGSGSDSWPSAATARQATSQEQSDDAAPPPSPSLRRTIEWLEKETLWDKERLEELCDAIRGESMQIILAGPPGTGKTWVAMRVAEYLTQNAGQIRRIIQFHPSYSYEEFMEGLRPEANEHGIITFQPVDGIVLDLVKQASGDGPHILLIDEINRANLPKVLGELMYLFEYREQTIDLRYTPNFKLPTSLRFIGTMNTADRSIRSIDTALRRRFDIWECPPDSGILERFYAIRANEVADLVAGFEKLNRTLTEQLDRHHTIGHTFFMANPMTRDRLQRVWLHKIAPLIEEYFFEAPSEAARYTVEAFWKV